MRWFCVFSVRFLSSACAFFVSTVECGAVNGDPLKGSQGVKKFDRIIRSMCGN